MRILIVHEVDWIKKVVYEIHHFSELLSLKNHDVFAIDCRSPSLQNVTSALRTEVVKNFHRVYDGASITLIRPATLSLPVLNRAVAVLTHHSVIKETIQQNDIEVVLLYSAPTNGIHTIRIAKKAGVPVVFRPIDVLHGLVRYPFLSYVTKKSEEIVYKESNKVLPVTARMAEYAIRMGAEPSKVKVLPLGVNTKYFKPKVKDKELANKLGISDEDKVIVFIGTLYDFAGLDHLILNFKEIFKDHPEAKLLIVGGGPAYEKFKKLSRQLKLDDKVIFTGYQPYTIIPSYINLASVCVNPFRINHITEDIIPIKMVEYLACGKPVVSTPLRGTVEMLPGEKAGVLYSYPDGFISSLQRVLSDESYAAKLSEAGLKYVQENFDWDAIVDRLVEELDPLNCLTVKPSILPQ